MGVLRCGERGWCDVVLVMHVWRAFLRCRDEAVEVGLLFRFL